MAEPAHLYAAGSLKTAFGEVAQDFSEACATPVETAFGPSGLMRGRIEDGEMAHAFASANTYHPRTLKEAGRGGPVTLFARNKPCALARPDVETSAPRPVICGSW